MEPVNGQYLGIGVTISMFITIKIYIYNSKMKIGNAQKPTIYDCRGANPKHNGEKKD